MYRHLSGRLKQLGINQADLAKKFNLSQASISHRFSGKVSWTLDEMYRLMDICQADPEELHIYFPRNGGLSA